MKKIALCIVLLLSTFSWAAPSPDEYSINVHVSSSHWVMSPAILVGPEPFLRLNVIIDGKKYELKNPALRWQGNPYDLSRAFDLETRRWISTNH